MSGLRGITVIRRKKMFIFLSNIPVLHYDTSLICSKV